MAGAVAAPDPGPMARFEDVVADPLALQELVRCVTEGRALKDVAKLWRVPYGRLAQWVVEDADRTSQYEGALRIWADSLAQETVRIADGGGEEEVGRDKLRIETRLKIASKLYRERYGEKVQVQHTGTPAADAGLLSAAGDLIRLVAKRAEPRVIEAEVLPMPSTVRPEVEPI